MEPATRSTDAEGAPVDDPRPPDGTAAPTPTRAASSGLGARVRAARAAQAELDGETRMRRLLAGLLVVQIPVVIVLLLTSPFLALVIDVVAVALGVCAALLFGPHDGDRQEPERDGASERLLAEQGAELEALRATVARTEASTAMLADLARRHRALLVRQLTKIDQLEADEQDPAALGELFALDHLATRMRRASESVLVLSGRDEVPPAGAPVASSEVLRGAVAEIEDFSRVEVTLDRDVSIAGPAVVDVVHLLAELVENATIFSSPTTPVRVHGHATDETFVVTVSDRGVGMAPARLAELNQQLAERRVPVTPGQVGFQVVATLAARHGIYVGVAASAGGGTEVSVVLPSTLLVGASHAAAAPPTVALLAQDDLLGTELSGALVDAPRWLDEPPAAAFSPPVAEPVAYDDPVAYDEPVADDEPVAYDVPDPYAPVDETADQPTPFVSYEQQYLAEGDLPAPSWDDLAWQPAPSSYAGASEEPTPWREPTQSPFVPAARVVDEPPAAGEPAWVAEEIDDAVAYLDPLLDPLVDPLEGGETYTLAGLQRRVPLANMAPQMAASDEPIVDAEVTVPAPDRSRHLFSAYRDGLTLGRHGLTSEPSPAENPDDPPAEEDYR